MPGSNKILRNKYDPQAHSTGLTWQPAKIKMPANPFGQPITDPWRPHASGVPTDYRVQGKSATSYEWNTAKALDNFGFTYQFQVSFAGGRRFSGGQVVDFLVNTTPMQTPLFVNGDYWHRDPTKEFYQQSMLDYYSGGTLNKVVTLWGADTKTLDDAMLSIGKMFA